MTAKQIVILVILIIVVVVGYLVASPSGTENQPPADETQVIPTTSTSSDVLSEIEAIDIGNVDQELQSIDNDLNSL